MATIKPHQTDIELDNNSWSNDPRKTSKMPRLDVCHTCGKSQALHPEGKCMFEASTFKPIDQDYDQFRRNFMSWIGGQKLEDGLCNIVYELTRRDR